MPAIPLCPRFRRSMAVVAAAATAAAASPPIASWRLPAVDWGGGGHRLPIPPGAQTVRAVDTIVWGGTTYAFTDVTPQGEIGAFSSKGGLSNWTYHGIVIRKNTSAADLIEVGTPSALVAKDGRVFVYFKYTAAHGPRGIGAACAAHPLGPFSRLPPPAAAPPHFRRPYGSGGIFDDSQVFEHAGLYHMLHSRKWSNDTPGCISSARTGRNDCIEWMVSADAEHWHRRGVVLAAHDSAVGPRNCTKADRGLACIHGGLEPMSARIYGDTLVLITDGREFEVFVAPVSELAASAAAGLKFEKASQAFLSSTSYAKLPGDYVPTALRVMPRQGEPLFCGVSQSHGGLSFVVYPLANTSSPSSPASSSSKLKTDDSIRHAAHSQTTRSRPLPDPYFPGFHVRPFAGHVNDPNGPFYDPVHGKFHLFMQYHSYAKSHGGMGWYHFASNDLTYWKALDGDSPHSNFTGMPTDGIGCPNTNGCFSGSATVTHLASAGGDAVPTIVYPGVHRVPESPDHPDGVGMAQCLARPANRSDPWLRRWRSIQIVPTDPVGPGVDLNNHFHDDAQPWRSASDGRWWTFASGGSWNRSRGVNILYSTTDEDWQAGASHWKISANPALWNITSGQCNFVSCPEMYPLPGVGYEQMWKSGPVVYESLCGGDQYWLGHYDDETHSFHANSDFLNYSGPPAVYDYGVGRASKSFWHAQSGRRLMWSWINDDRSGAGFADHASWMDEHGQNHSFTWDSLQSVPRVITLDPQYHRSGRPRGILKVNPAVELDQLRKHPAAGVLRGAVLGGASGKQSAVLARGLSTQIDVVANISFSRLPRLEIAIMHGAANKETVIRLGASNTAVTNYSIMENTNIRAGDNPGEDFSLEVPPSSDHKAAEACIAGCKQHSDCVAWTYVRPKNSNKNGRCAIKGSKHLGTMVDQSTISGFMPGHEPQQPLPSPLPTVELDRTHSGELHERVGPAKSMPLSQATAVLVTLRILYDNSVLEIYDGSSVMSHRVYPMLPLGPVTLTLRVEQGESTVDAAVYNMGNAVTFSAPDNE